MLSNKNNILQLVSLMKAHNVTRVVLCPGSRNAPIVHTIVESGEFDCYSITDERSAGFFALGVCDAAGGAPTAVCCTSGSALLDIAPAVAEAYYRNLPLLVISADRPEMWIGQLDGQTMCQAGALANVVKRSVQLIEPQSSDEYWYCNRLVNEALLTLSDGCSGPVHINVPISEPLFEFTIDELPKERVVRIETGDCVSKKLNDRLKAEFCSALRPMIIVGQGVGDCDSGFLQEFQERTGTVIISENLSNMSFVSNADQILHVYDVDEGLRPDFLITVGGHVVSKRLKNFIRKYPPQHHWHLGRDSRVVDTYKCVDRIFPNWKLKELLAELVVTTERSVSGFSDKWYGYSNSIVPPFFDEEPKEVSSYAAVKYLLASGIQGNLHLANSSAVRISQLFRNESLKYFCNRGINGIDGSLSTAVGYSASNNRGEGEFDFLIIGDLSFFYDQNGLWNKYHDDGLRILLLNNGCGEIFRHLPGLECSANRDEYVAAQHLTTAEGIASQTGCAYFRAETIDELREGIRILTSPSGSLVERDFNGNSTDGKTIILEVLIDAACDERVNREYYESIKKKNI